MSSNSSKRRVPEAQRRRAIASCDRCKTKRIKCTKVAATGANDLCKSCRDGGFKCEWSIPRKKRLYGSIEPLSLRYRALDALVQGLFPEEDVNDLQTLYRLAHERNITIPSYEEVNMNDEATEMPTCPTSRPQQRQPDLLTIPEEDPVSSISPFRAAPAVANPVHWPCNIDQTVQGTVVSLEEETCIPAPHGVAHYVGPASSFEFANAIRKLVSMRSRELDSVLPESDHRNKTRKQFANLKTSIALEPRIGNHPASAVRPVDDSMVDGTFASSPSADINLDQTSEGISGSHSTSMGWLQTLLPSKQVSDNLVYAFFDIVHPNYVLFHRGTFQSQYELIWQRNTTPGQSYETEPGWLCSLFMVLVFGAQSLEQKDPEIGIEIQRELLGLVRGKFPHLSLTASLANVQALLLLQLYEHNAGERNTAWILLGQAARMAIALGMHREGTSHNFGSIERNTRRMVWFTLYSFEQYSALVLGRPSTIKALEVNINLPDEALMDGNNYPPQFLLHASRLMDLISKVKHFTTAASPNCFNQNLLLHLYDSANSLRFELIEWSNGLPAHLRPEWQFMTTQHQRAVLMLHITHHHLSSVITRSYLLCMVEKRMNDSFGCGPDNLTERNQERAEQSEKNLAITTLGSECLSSASLVAHLVQQVANCSRLEGVVWLDFFYIYHAILVLCLDFFGQTQSESRHRNIEHNERKTHVLSLVKLCRDTRLGPTYQILSQVAIQFAAIVGLISDITPSAGEDDIIETDARNKHRDLQNCQSFQQRTLNLSANRSALNQNDTFVPYAEPISDAYHFNGDYLDFFNIGGTTHTDWSFDSVDRYPPNPFSDLFGH